jgi:hypothetical protein
MSRTRMRKMKVHHQIRKIREREGAARQQLIRPLLHPWSFRVVQQIVLRFSALHSPRCRLASELGEPYDGAHTRFPKATHKRALGR